MLPWSSVARTRSVCSPGSGFQLNCQRTHTPGAAGEVISASCQGPSSMRYWTVAIRFSPANARPRIICGSGRSRAGQGNSTNTVVDVGSSQEMTIDYAAGSAEAVVSCGGCSAAGSEVMILTGGIEVEDGKNTLLEGLAAAIGGRAGTPRP